MGKPDTLNKFAVASAGTKRIVILNLPLQALVRGASTTRIPTVGALSDWPCPSPLSVDEALNLAAWLVAVTGKRKEFDELLDAVERT